MNRLNTAKRSGTIHSASCRGPVDPIPSCERPAFQKSRSSEVTRRYFGRSLRRFPVWRAYGAECEDRSRPTRFGPSSTRRKEHSVDRIGEFGVGDVWLWTAVDAPEQVDFSWHVGMRRLAAPRSSATWPVGLWSVQPTTSVYSEPCLTCSERTVSTAQLVKRMEATTANSTATALRFALVCKKTPRTGDPDEKAHQH